MECNNYFSSESRVVTHPDLRTKSDYALMQGIPLLIET
jgi:hypothetical protein